MSLLSAVPRTRFRGSRRWPLFLILVLLLPGACARMSKEGTATTPGAINISADIQARDVRRALTLQKLTRNKPEAESYVIGTNDVLEIKVFKHPDVDVSSRVGGDGLINISPLGNIKAAGLNERQLEVQIQDGLRGVYYQDPHVTVFVKEIQARMVGIVGAVNLPGQYSSFGQMYLADLISKAGGLKPEAGEAAYVTRFKDDAFAARPLPPPGEDGRGSTTTLDVDLDGLLLHGQREWNIALQAGDLVNIPTAGMVFITGPGINKPGTYPLTRRMTLQQLVDQAEGLRFEANHRLLLVRIKGMGGKEVFTVDYDKLRQCPTADIQLRPEDKVIINRTFYKAVLAAVGNSLSQVFRILISANYELPINKANRSLDNSN